MKSKIKVVIVDDNEIFLNSLESLLTVGFENIQIVGKATSVNDAINAISKNEPDLVFLDVEIIDGTGFDVLSFFKTKTFKTIFTTAHNEFAKKAFEFDATHYLNKDEICYATLKVAIVRYMESTFKSTNLNNSHLNLENVILPTKDGQNIFLVKDILRCEAKDNYTDVIMNDKTKYLISKTLLKVSNILDNSNFVRIHSKHLINLIYIKRYTGGISNKIILIDGTEFKISDSYRNQFQINFKKFAKTL